jgi:8-amino-7-oxononanoate synthase
MINTLTQNLMAFLKDKESQSLYRRRQAKDPRTINFSSNDYLSLSQHPLVRQAYQQGYADYPVGSAGSIVLSGYHETHQALELSFARALAVEDCLLFSSGYMANLAVVSLLAQFGVHVLIDKAVHASIYDGLNLSKAKYTRYLHNDLMNLEDKLSTISGPMMVMTESVFSMSGQKAPLALMSDLAQRFGAGLIVDEAHGFGVLGPKGMGACPEAGLTSDQIPLRIIPFGKAMAGSGAIVAGKSLWIDALLQVSRQAVYSTSISPAMAHGLRCSLDLLQAEDQRREHLRTLIDYFKQKIAQSQLTWRDSCSAIQQLRLGCPKLALEHMRKLAEQGIICYAIRQPTVPKADSGLRIVLNYDHQFEQIDQLFEALES